VPTLEKGDEPLSQHHEETVHASEKLNTNEGFSMLQKVGLLGVVLGLIAVFLKARSSLTKRGHAGYEKTLA